MSRLRRADGGEPAIVRLGDRLRRGGGVVPALGAHPDQAAQEPAALLQRHRMRPHHAQVAGGGPRQADQAVLHLPDLLVHQRHRAVGDLAVDLVDAACDRVLDRQEGVVHLPGLEGVEGALEGLVTLGGERRVRPRGEELPESQVGVRTRRPLVGDADRRRRPGLSADVESPFLVPPRVGQDLAQDPAHEVARESQGLALAAPAREDLALAIGVVERRRAVLALEAGDPPHRLHPPRQESEKLVVDLVDRGA